MVETDGRVTGKEKKELRNWKDLVFVGEHYSSPRMHYSTHLVSSVEEPSSVAHSVT